MNQINLDCNKNNDEIQLKELKKRIIDGSIDFIEFYKYQDSFFNNEEDIKSETFNIMNNSINTDIINNVDIELDKMLSSIDYVTSFYVHYYHKIEFADKKVKEWLKKIIELYKPIYPLCQRHLQKLSTYAANLCKPAIKNYIYDLYMSKQEDGKYDVSIVNKILDNWKRAPQITDFVFEKESNILNMERLRKIKVLKETNTDVDKEPVSLINSTLSRFDMYMKKLNQYDYVIKMMEKGIYIEPEWPEIDYKVK